MSTHDASALRDTPTSECGNRRTIACGYVRESRISTLCYAALAFALAGLIGELGCGKRPAGGISVDPAFRRVLPPDTRVLAGVDIEKLKKAPFYRAHESSLYFPLLDAWSERTGLDLWRDVSDLVLAWNGTGPLFMMRGQLRPAVVERKIVPLSAAPRSYKRYRVFGENENSIVFLKKGLAVAGPIGAVHAAIDRETEGDNQIPEELERGLTTLPQASQIWAVSRGGLPVADLPMRSEYSSALSNFVGYVQDTAIAATIDKDVHVFANLTCVSAAGAQRVYVGLRATKAFARLTAKQDQQDLVRLYDAVRIDKDGDVVRVHADFSADLADKLLEYLPRVSRRTS